MAKTKFDNCKCRSCSEWRRYGKRRIRKAFDMRVKSR